MSVRTKELVENCPVFIASQILGRKWAIIILQELLTPEARAGLRFNQIQKDLDWITPKVLTERLRQFAEQGLLNRTVDASTIPPSVTYKLTEKGEGLREAIVAMQNWGRKFSGRITADCLGPGLDRCQECRSIE